MYEARRRRARAQRHRFAATYTVTQNACGRKRTARPLPQRRRTGLTFRQRDCSAAAAGTASSRRSLALIVYEKLTLEGSDIEKRAKVFFKVYTFYRSFMPVVFAKLAGGRGRV